MGKIKHVLLVYSWSYLLPPLYPILWAQQPTAIWWKDSASTAPSFSIWPLILLGAMITLGLVLCQRWKHNFSQVPSSQNLQVVEELLLQPGVKLVVVRAAKEHLLLAIDQEGTHFLKVLSQWPCEREREIQDGTTCYSH